MQLWEIHDDTKLAELSDLVGTRNVDQVLHVNEIPRVPNVGKAFKEVCDSAVASVVNDIDWQRKSSLLNKLVGDSDIFEAATLMGSSGWKLLSTKGTLPGYIIIPDLVAIPDTVRLLGNKQGVLSKVYNDVMNELITPPHYVSPTVFNEYSAIRPSRFISSTDASADVFEYFNIPWGEITLWSSLSDESVDIPVYPEEVSDSHTANYTDMPEILYQYEPWPLYTSSGPRSNSYTFEFHRDMWNGDHNKGGANYLIRFCQANCYPEYNGSAVNTSTVALYVHGKKLIEGIMKDVSVDWDGPIGHDGWYLHCKMTLNIQEVSSTPLNYWAIRQKGVIG